MKKKLFVLLAVILILSVVTITALATPPDNEVGGRWCYGNLVEGEHKIAGRNEFYDLDDSGAWIGTFEGYSSDEGRVQIHPSGYTILKSNVSFESVVVDGKTGGLEMRINGWLPVGGDLSDYEGLWVITSGTGELAGLQGQGTWGGVELFNSECSAIDEIFFASVPYSGSIHFEGN